MHCDALYVRKDRVHLGGNIFLDNILNVTYSLLGAVGVSVFARTSLDV